MSGHLAVIAGPTAVGKGTVVRYLLSEHPELKLSISATTREPRPGEQDGVDYYFWSKDRFEKAIVDGALLEYAKVHGNNYYGTPKQPVVEALSRGETIILEIDLQGARLVKESLPEAVTIFIQPPSWEELVRRLTSRATESEDEQQNRLETAKVELAAATEFDHVVVNDEVAKCAARILELLT